jgi:hypothetical protein
MTMFRPQTTALGEDQLCALRRAAAMAHTTGAIGLRLSAGGVTLADVVPHDDNPGVLLDRWRAEPEPGLRIDPCGFRLAVANAWADHAAGCRVGLVGLDAGEALDVAWTVGPPGRLLGFGAVRTLCATRMVWAFPSLLAPSALSAVLADVAADGDPPSATILDGLAAQLIHDELLEATVVHVEVDPISCAGPPPSSTARVLDEVLRRMVAAVGAAEVVEALLP